MAWLLNSCLGTFVEPLESHDVSVGLESIKVAHGKLKVAKVNELFKHAGLAFRVNAGTVGHLGIAYEATLGLATVHLEDVTLVVEPNLTQQLYSKVSQCFHELKAVESQRPAAVEPLRPPLRIPEPPNVVKKAVYINSRAPLRP